MDPRKHNTLLLTKEEAQSSKKWYILDASGKTLGRFASEVAKILRGKHKVNFTPHVDSGDGVIIINAGGITVTGEKERKKIYSRYTGFVGGLRQISYALLKAKRPDRIIRHAVRGMIPKTKLGEAQLKRLRIFAGVEHNMEAQKPLAVEI